MKKLKHKGKVNTFSTVHPDAAGIDIGSQFHVVAVSPERDSEPVRSFQSFTGDLYRLADWLISMGITTVVMESTGIYWIPLFEILQSRGLEVVVLSTREMSNMCPAEKRMSMMLSGCNNSISLACYAAAFIRPCRSVN